jgi:hypothetical protein
VFLREPVDNLISIYFFWRASRGGTNPTHDRFLTERPSIVDFARYCRPIRRLMSMTYFGGMDIRSLDFVGFHETRARDLGRLSAQLGVPLVHTIHENATAPDAARRALAEDDRTLSILRSLLADDLAFYEKARARWD